MIHLPPSLTFSARVTWVEYCACTHNHRTCQNYNMVGPLNIGGALVTQEVQAS